MSTIINDEYNVPLTIQEWILTILDYHNKILFTGCKEIDNTTLEVQTTASNFAIAMKWARNHLSYIKQIVLNDNSEHAIVHNSSVLDTVNEWEIPKPPEIKLFPTISRPNIPNTINSNIKYLKIQNQNKQNTENDNQIVATVKTTWSSSKNEISDLNSDSRHQLSLTHNSRMNQLEVLLTTNIQEMNDHYKNIQNRLQLTEPSNEYLQSEMDSIMASLSHLSNNIKSQQSQLLCSVNNNTEFCQITSNTLKEVQSIHQNTNQQISHLEDMVSKLIHHTTPLSSG
jgi:predicted  nucleic acid-binding Zn-ribbon protein